MSEELRDPDVVADVVRRRVLRALVPVVKKLQRAACGERMFGDDHEARACLALVRLVPALLSRPVNGRSRGPVSLVHPSHSPETAARLLAELQWLQENPTPDPSPEEEEEETAGITGAGPRSPFHAREES
jgi:hypothetical protein